MVSLSHKLPELEETKIKTTAQSLYVVHEEEELRQGKGIYRAGDGVRTKTQISRVHSILSS